MATDGDVTVWISNGYAFARLEAQTRSGPIVVQASAPLAIIRRRMLDAATDRGDVPADAVMGEDLVRREAKRAAMGKLKRLAPYAFLPAGALATYYGVRELRRRRGGRPGAPGAGEPADTDDAMEGLDVGDAATKQAGAVALQIAKQDPKVRAGIFLLRKARTDPRARRKIKVIRARAASGDPQAQQSMATLRRAQKVRKVLVRHQRVNDQVAARRLALIPVPRPPRIAAPGGSGPGRYRGFFSAYDRGAE